MSTPTGLYNRARLSVDHLIRELPEARDEQLPYLQVQATLAQAQATLALVEQLRIQPQGAPTS